MGGAKIGFWDVTAVGKLTFCGLARHGDFTFLRDDCGSERQPFRILKRARENALFVYTLYSVNPPLKSNANREKFCLNAGLIFLKFLRVSKSHVVQQVKLRAIGQSEYRGGADAP